MNCKSFNTWKVIENRYDQDKASFYESLFSLGNGYMGARGFHSEEEKEPHENMVFVAGVFDYIKPGITDFVNTPNIFYIRLYIDNQLVNPFSCEITDYMRELDMKEGVLRSRLTIKDDKGRMTLIEHERFFSLFDKHLAVSRYRVTPLDYEGDIAVTAGIDGSSANNPVPDDQLKSESEILSLFNINMVGLYKENAAFMKLNTKSRSVEIAEAVCVVCAESLKGYTDVCTERFAGVQCSIYSKAGNAAAFDIFTSVYTSRDGIRDIENTAKEAAVQAASKGFNKVRDDSTAAWAEKWDMCDIRIDGDDLLQQGLRFNIFHLISSNAEDDSRVSVGARGLTHSRYKGCYFWDTEIFMLPFFTYTNPEAAKNLLRFRYNTLSAAEQNAASQNLMGARYPWMCNSDGLEQCETWDIGFSEVHITADIAYAIDNYVSASGDFEFFLDYGAEIIIKIARYWASRFTYDAQSDLYNMLYVKGPNEYGGVTINNTYTTMLALHNLELGKRAIEMLKVHRREKWEALSSSLGFNDDEILNWDEIIKKAKINYDKERHLYIEDDNFYKLEPLDIKAFKQGDTPLYKTICFDRLQRYRVLKQADVILLMCLLPDKFNEHEMRAAWEEYEPITLHDSSLSYGTHSQFAALLDLRAEAYSYLMKSVRLDIDDIMNSTGKEGMHFAGLGASWQAFIFGLCGIYSEVEGLTLKPHLPEHIKHVDFKLIYKGRKYQFDIINTDESKKFNISVLD